MEKVSENLLLFCRNLQANVAQFFWDTLYESEAIVLLLENGKWRYPFQFVIHRKSVGLYLYKFWNCYYLPMVSQSLRTAAEFSCGTQFVNVVVATVFHINNTTRRTAHIHVIWKETFLSTSPSRTLGCAPFSCG